MTSARLLLVASALATLAAGLTFSMDRFTREQAPVALLGVAVWLLLGWAAIQEWAR